MGGLALLLILFFALYLHPIIYVAFDREFARSQGIPVQVFEYVLKMCIRDSAKMDLAAEREYMFDHVYRQQQKRFYNTNMHGVDSVSYTHLPCEAGIQVKREQDTLAESLETANYKFSQ